MHMRNKYIVYKEFEYNVDGVLFPIVKLFVVFESDVGELYYYHAGAMSNGFVLDVISRPKIERTTQKDIEQFSAVTNLLSPIAYLSLVIKLNNSEFNHAVIGGNYEH